MLLFPFSDAPFKMNIIFVQSIHNKKMEQLSDFLLQVIEFVGVKEIFDFQPQTVTYDLDRFDVRCLRFAAHDVSDG
jgi:hypothetical protein